MPNDKYNIITPRNYAANVELMFRRLAQRGSSVGRFAMTVEENIFAQHLADCIKKSVHFVIPDEGILNNGGDSLVRKEWHLPYRNITVEHYSPISNTKYVCIAEEDGDFIQLAGAVCEADSSRWIPCPVGDVSPCVFSYESWLRLAFPSIKIDSQLIVDVANEIFWTVTELVEALSCRNVGTDTYQAESKVNNKRIKKGKLPFYETKILVVNAPKQARSGLSINKGTHASPRQHLRRGHIRRLDGYNIWVNSCVVGDHNRGNISKKYIVKRNG